MDGTELPRSKRGEGQRGQLGSPLGDFPRRPRDSKSLLTKIHWSCPRPSVRMKGTAHGELPSDLSTQNSDIRVRLDESQPLTPAPHLPPGNFNPAWDAVAFPQFQLGKCLLLRVSPELPAVTSFP